MAIEISFTVNTLPYKVTVEPETPLLDILRNRLNLTGTKEGCGTGDCGACTVLLNGMAVKSCLTWAASADGADIITVEGLTDDAHPLHPLQEAFVEAGAIQCGFCTPGFLLSAYAMLKENPHPEKSEILQGLSGNICRCTGYETIYKAIRIAAEKMGG